MIVASPAAAAAALRPSMRPGNVPTHLAASMPTAAALSLFAAATSFPRWSASSRPSRFAPISPPARSDMENCAGDWFLLDQEMDKALRFSGYDYFFRIINGGHVAGYYDYFREAMSFIWKDWPQPVQAGPSAPRVRDIILPDEKWQMVARGCHDARGPACNAGGEVFFVDAADNKIYRIDLDGNVNVFLSDAGQANSLSFGRGRPTLRGFRQDRENHEL